MIFVTVGTHEQSFNRLLEEIDKLVEKSFIEEKVVVQTGYSSYIPKNCEYHKFLSLHEMEQKLKEARIVITHGGPASFIASLQIGKIPIVVPRQEKYGEHINNHQVEFVKLIDEKMNNIIPVYDICTLKDKILNYDKISNSDINTIKSNNAQFIKKFEEIVDSLFA
ncbi:glycosyltransferase [Limosilactobacillus reuteri]|uniref:Glycosyltransferase n=1 Tax=Limosilactobacillus reuteri TaxID=1598 RepID=A0A3M6SBR0_LIMRT|nr:glycosyltransferase [Limosilactobacillus reuteri]MCC4352754.1 glycosyltransferase [Limosilactobacillus reuteri]MCC4377177.1 glycosyltransferase [Limosilactobacillus reuteri]RMX24913.1 glycosyltransferase [Limosilactobacillus reuteri]